MTSLNDQKDRTLNLWRMEIMSPRSKRWFFLGLALLVLGTIPMHAQERVTLQLNGSGQSAIDSQDRAINTWIDQGNPTTDHHATDASLAIQAVSAGNPLAQRAMLEFDTRRIPRSGIKSATVQVWLNSLNSPTTAGSFQGDFPRNWQLDPVNSFNAVPLSYAISWTNRSNQLGWTTAGGDFTTGGPQISTGTPVAFGATGVALSPWDVTSTVKNWFGGYPPSANFGFIIKDVSESSDILFAACNGTPANNNCDYGLIASNQDGTTSHRPAMVVQFIQEVQNLTSTPGSSSVVLNWTYPAAVANGTIVNATTGVVIVRSTGTPVPNNALFTDGTAIPAACSTVNGTAAIVITPTTTAAGLPTTFTDPGTCTAPANNTTYFYKVFAVAKIGATTNFNYSTNGTGALAGVDNSFVTEISATPGATAAARQSPSWIAPVQAASLAAPGIDPGHYVLATTNNSLVQAFDPATGNDVMSPVSIGGSVTSRMPLLEADEADYGPQTFVGAHPMTYLAGGGGGVGDNLVYDVELDNNGFVGDFLNPVSFTGSYTGGVAVQAKAFSNVGNTKPNDVMIMGTHVSGVNPTNNFIFAAVTCNLSVGPGGGCQSSGGGWNIQGGNGNGLTSLGCGAGPATCLMDVINSTPFIDYTNNTVWVTSHNNGDAGAAANLPDVWKLNANTGAVLAAINLGSNIDSSPSNLPDGSAILVGTGTGALFAFDAVTTVAGPPTVPTQLATTAGVGDGAVKGFPVIATTSSPYTIIVSTTSKVTAYSFATGGSSFTQLWSTPMGCNPSAPLTVPGLLDASSNPVVYVGCSDGKLHELLLSNGVDEAASARVVDTTGGVVVGDPTLDVTLNKVIVGASDGRVYAFSFPF